MSFSRTWLFAGCVALWATGCDPKKVQEHDEAAAKAQAVADSLMAMYEAQADSAAAAAAMDSTTFALDSGVWDIEEPGEEEYEYTELDEGGLAYEDWKHVADDTIAIDRRRFNEAALDHYLEDPDLDYDRELEHENLWWTRFMRWLGDRLGDLFGTRGGRVVFENFHWIILAVAVIFVLWYFREHLFTGVFGMGAKTARLVTEMPENIQELDLDKLLRDAEKTMDWRMALRYQWWKVLRKLVDEGRIKWQPRFTDADYLSQLKEPALRATFSELSFLFKWVWYGDAPMDARRYQDLKPAFEAAHHPSAPATKPAEADKPVPTVSASR